MGDARDCFSTRSRGPFGHSHRAQSDVTITFDAAVFSTAKSIVLTGGELAVTETLVVNGQSSRNVTISGNSASRIFNLATLHNLTLNDLILAAGGVVSYRHGEVTLSMNKTAKHPVLRNFEKLTLTDEPYWKMAGDLKPERVLATAVKEKQPWPQIWSLEPGAGRVFVSIPGHYSWTFDVPLFRVLLLRGIACSAKQSVDCFNDLVWPGATIAK